MNKLMLTAIWTWMLMGLLWNARSAAAQETAVHIKTNVREKEIGRYADVNGLHMYYEIYGSGKPLILIHGGGSTIESNYGHVLPEFAKRHQVIAMELQAHGHTPDIGRPLSFEQDADDVAALLKLLNIDKADVIGFSNGGTTALQFAIRHPEFVNKLVLLSANFRRSGMQPGFFEGFKNASMEKMLPKDLKEAYLKANPDPKGLQKMFDRDVARMVSFKDISDVSIKAIQAPVLIVNGDTDLVRPEHAMELFHLLPHARLAIIPGGHGEYLGEIASANKDSKIPQLVTAMIEEFFLK